MNVAVHVWNWAHCCVLCFAEVEFSTSIMDQIVLLPLGPEVEVLQVSENVSDAVNDEVPGKIFICA